MSVRKWAVWRRIQYATGFFVLLASVSTLLYFTSFYKEPTCADGIQNGDERGVDCGGGCVLICTADVLQPSIVWASSFQISDGQYNTVAYIENPNQSAASPEMQYTFQLLSGGEVVAERSGKTVLPPNSAYPVFEGRIRTPLNKPVTETRIIIEPVTYWLPSAITRDQFRTIDIDLTRVDTKPQLDVTVENTSPAAAKGIEVVATIFSGDGTPVTASQTIIEDIGPNSTEDLVFTWPNPIAKTIRSCSIPTDVALAIDLSGSMNNDNDVPPEPITAALAAAGEFVGSLQEKDQVAVVSFATDAKLISALTGTHKAVSDLVLALTIDPKEETGFTNTVAALEAARAELLSERHNDNARRVLVLLTDGLPTVSGDADVIALAEQRARELDAGGVEVYAIGLGENVDRQFIQNIASTPENAYFAPTGAELRNVYAEITTSLCEVGPTKIDVIAKPKTTFVPPK